MKNTRFVLVSCVAVGALIASPAFSKPAKKAGGASSRPQRAAPRTAQMMPRMGGAGHNGGTRYNNTRSYMGRQYTSTAPQRTAIYYGSSTPRYHSGTRYTGTGSYAGGQYSGTRYYGSSPGYGANTYYGGTRYYYGGNYPYYGSSSVWPYVAASVAPYVASSWWAPGYGYGYPYSYYGGYPYNYSYYGSGYGYGYAGSTVAAVQRRLGELGYYHGVVDGVIGPRTRSAIAAFESRHGMIVDGRISRSLIDTLGLA